MGYVIGDNEDMMEQAKEDNKPKIHPRDIEAVLSTAGWPDKRTHELVLPPCLIENPYFRHDGDVVAFDVFADLPYIVVESINGYLGLFGYDTRYDPNATEMAILPKQVEPPLPFD